MEERYNLLLDVIKYNHNPIILPTKVYENKQLVIDLIKANCTIFSTNSFYLRNNKEIVMVAVKEDGSLLKYASDELKNDKEVVLHACETSSKALKYASDELKSDEDFILEVCKCSIYSILYAHSSMLSNKKIMLEVIKNVDYDDWRHLIKYKDAHKYSADTVIKHLELYTEPAKFPFNSTIFPDCKYN